jgi:hypothetical protein
MKDGQVNEVEQFAEVLDRVTTGKEDLFIRS